MTELAELVIRKDNFEDFYDVLDEIGRGQFAVVKKCVEKSTSSEFAAKFMKKKRGRSSGRRVTGEQVNREAAVLQKVRHDGVIYLHEVFETSTEFTLVMELLSGGELFEFLVEEEYLTECEAMDFTHQVVKAVNYLHDCHVVHLDIKPENIVLKDRVEKKVKLIDFGLARIIPPGEVVKAIMGTPEFVAPEVINFEPVGTPTDMWAVGVLTYILLSGASPFLGEDDNETFINIQNVDYEFDEEYFAQISSHAKEFITGLLCKKTSDRLSARDCLKHPWLQPEPEASLKRRSTLIKTESLKAFTARTQWRKSLKKVIAVNRLAVLAKKGSGNLAMDVLSQVTNQSEGDHKTILEETCNESELEIDECEVEIVPNSCLDILEEETVLIRRKLLQTADATSAIDFAQKPIKEDKDLNEEKIERTEYQELISLIEDHVILPFDLHEWENNRLPVIQFKRKETTV